MACNHEPMHQISRMPPGDIGTESDIFQFQIQNAVDSFVLRMLETQCLESVIDIDFKLRERAEKMASIVYLWLSND